MRHQNKKYNIGSSPSHRRSLLRNLAIELIDHGKVETTFTKCKAVQPFVEKLVTLAKEDTVANRRLAFAKLNNKLAVQALFANVSPKHKVRAGGYTRIFKIADKRVGDGASVGIITFVTE